ACVGFCDFGGLTHLLMVTSPRKRERRREIKSPVSPEGFSPFSGYSTILSQNSKVKPVVIFARLTLHGALKRKK
ncbi:MAG: hypothetical protein LAT83_20620, partial [Kiritimatiellae bacterium]|nr:hypothetical protein [Kiritimatiellia bacterium]